MSAAMLKQCTKCGLDVSNQKRVKDQQGRYYCPPCIEALKAAGAVASSAPAVTAPAPPPADDGIFDLAPVAPTPAPVRLVPAIPKVVVKGNVAPPVSEKWMDGGGGPVCPSCEKETALGAKICIACGIKVPSGRPVITSLGLDEEEFDANARRIIRPLAWLLRLGLFPIASEAYGARKPIVIWTMAALMTVTSIAYFIALQENPESRTLTQLMLWPLNMKHAVTDEDILQLFHKANQDNPDNDWKAQADQLADNGSKDDLDQRAITVYRAAEELEPPPGEFRWYQLLTNAFLHDPSSIWRLVMHLGGNMLFLLIFGTRVNALVGNLKMAFLYPLLAILASGAQLLFTHDRLPALGASGAIMGLAGMYFIFFPVHRVYMAFWVKIMWGVPAWIKIWTMRGFWVLGFYLAFDIVGVLYSHDHVGHWAHLGGFIAGTAIALLLLMTRLQSARHADLISVLLGKRAWPLIGKPDRLIRATVLN